MKLKVLVVVVVESGKGVICKRQYAQVWTTRVHLKLTHLKEKVQSDQNIKKSSNQIVKVHPLEESRVKVLQIFVHRLTLDLLENVEIRFFCDFSDF